MSAFVEIIFDNSDDRFPTGKPELTLRRTIGMKKDEYTLDRKSATKTDVNNLLESAGFSRSNPYYIVPQGRVTALTNMKDGERLTLLKDVAGTQVYESRRVESLKIIEETRTRRQKIDELLDYIHQRLSELEEEKEELQDFQAKDRDRRCLQFTIDHREQLAIADELDALDEQRQNGINDTDDYAERFLEGEFSLKTVADQLAETKQQLELLRVDQDQLEQERRDISKNQAHVDLEYQSLRSSEKAAHKARQDAAREISSLEESIQKHQHDLVKVLEEFRAQESIELNAKSHLDELSAQRARLYEKQGRNAQFRNQQERDRWLSQQILANKPQLEKMQRLKKEFEKAVVDIETQIREDEHDISMLRDKINGQAAETSERRRLLEHAQSNRDRLMDERKELWREDAKLDSVMARSQTELRIAEKELSHTMDHDTSRGIANLGYLKSHIAGIHGTLAELMEVDEYYRRAVEVTAGQSLFHCVVDNDETASRAIEILLRERLGRLTFVPLNRIKPRSVSMPKANDAIPMIEKIVFDAQFAPAFHQVFGQSIICPSLTVAGQYARSHGVNGVTLDGDRSDRKGAFTGGSLDARRSRLSAMRQVSRWRRELETSRARSEEVKNLLERKDQEVTLAVGELQKLESRPVQSSLKQQLQGKTDGLLAAREELEKKQRACQNVDVSQKALMDQQEAYEGEKASKFKKNLTSEEEALLETLGSQVTELETEFAKVSAKRSELESRKNVLEISLRENLQPRLAQLEGGEDEITDDRSLGRVQKELERRNKMLQEAESRVRESHGKIEATSETLLQLQSQHDDIKAAQHEIAREMEKTQKRLEKSIQKKRILTERAQSVNNRIRDLGILPHGALEKYERTKSEEVVKLLHETNEALKKYSHVNKKAFEQYNNFTTQRETLTGRQEELDSSHESISELIAVLDQRKDEAIERTFKQVSKEFAAVFEKLVPAGRGRLIIQRKMDRRHEEEEDSDEEERNSVENYTGVGISVSFNSKEDEQQRIQQLSGGQKSLCALALVFAIQQCDPAPFYLFDEIDANLDAQYRTAVANMLQEISEKSSQAVGDRENFGSGQFICTTFRPEMLLAAEKCYGVRYLGNKSSSVVVVDKDEALKFVEGEKR